MNPLPTKDFRGIAALAALQHPSRSPQGPWKLFETHCLKVFGFFRTSLYRGESLTALGSSDSIPYENGLSMG